LQLCLLSPYWGAATRPGNQPTQRRPRIWKRKRARDEMGPPNQLQKVENLRWKLEQTPGPNLGSDLAVSSFGHANNTHYNTHVSQAYITNHHHKEIMNSSSNIEFPSKKKMKLPTGCRHVYFHEQRNNLDLPKQLSQNLWMDLPNMICYFSPVVLSKPRSTRRKEKKK